MEVIDHGAAQGAMNHLEQRDVDRLALAGGAGVNQARKRRP